MQTIFHLNKTQILNVAVVISQDISFLLRFTSNLLGTRNGKAKTPFPPSKIGQPRSGRDGAPPHFSLQGRSIGNGHENIAAWNISLERWQHRHSNGNVEPPERKEGCRILH